MIEVAGHKFETEDILRRVIWNLPTHTKNYKKPRWVLLMNALGMGSTVSMGICRQLGFDPNEEI